MTKRSRALSWLALVPAATVIDLSLPSVDGVPVGIARAFADTGQVAASASAWGSLYPTGLRDAEPLQAATDGFFTLRASVYGLSAAAAEAQVQVAVRDDAGEEVAGDLSLLAAQEGSARGDYLFGWTARQPLQVGAQLAVTLAVDASAATRTPGAQFALVIAGEPTPLPVPDAQLQGWRKYYRGEWQAQSEAATCLVAPPGAQPYDAPLPSHVVERTAATVTWTPPAAVGGVAWVPRVELRAEDGELRQSTASTPDDVFFGALDAGVGALFINDAIFPDGADEYCVDVVLTDLRTGLEQREQLCSAPGPRTGLADADASILQCSAAPDAPDLARVWCEVRGEDLEAEGCAQHLESASAALTDAASVSEGQAQGDLDGAAGCTIGEPRPAQGAALMSLAALGLVALLRRRSQLSVDACP